MINNVIGGNVKFINDVSVKGDLSSFNATSINGGAVSGGSKVNLDYEPILNKPQINFKTLNAGNNTYEYLGVEPTITDITEQDIDNLIFGG